jgi:hypothetical protein
MNVVLVGEPEGKRPLGRLDRSWVNNIKMDVREIGTASVAYWSEFLVTDPEVRVRFPELPDSLRSSGSGRGSTQPREHN